jgi:hypothetical protein
VIHCNPKAAPCGVSARPDDEWRAFGRLTDVSAWAPLNSSTTCKNHPQLKKRWEWPFSLSAIVQGTGLRSRDVSTTAHVGSVPWRLNGARNWVNAEYELWSLLRKRRALRAAKKSALNRRSC